MIMANLVAVPATKLRIFLVDDDTHRHRPLYQVILKLLHEADIESAVVFKGCEGFGARRVIHTDRIELLSFSLPLIIEATDSPEKIEAAAPRIANILGSGLIEITRCTIVRPPLETGNRKLETTS